MATFPTLQPSSRVFSPGDYPHTPFTAMSGRQNRVRHSTVMLGSRLQLSFVAISQADMLSIKTHYDGQQGTYLAFDIPAMLTDGLTAADFTLTSYAWRYVEPPRVEDYCPQLHTVSVVLESLPPEGAVVGGISQATNMIIKLSLNAGAPTASSNATGFNSTITASLAPGTATADLIEPVGFDQVVPVSFDAGIVTTSSEALGCDLTVAASLDSGIALESANGLDLTVTATMVGGAAKETDPNFSSVSLLLHMDGSNNSTTFTDSSSLARSITRTGSGVISTGVTAKYGSASYYSNTLNDKLTASGTETIGTGDFTVEFWWYPLVFANGYKIFFRIENPSSGYKWSFTSNDDATSRKLFFFKETPGFTYVTDGNAALTIATNSWRHVALTRSGTTLRIFYNGILHQTGTLSDNISGNLIMLLHATGSNSNGFGYIDDFRLTNGVARYTANFTPPSKAFPDS